MCAARVEPAGGDNQGAPLSEEIAPTMPGAVDFVGRVADAQSGNLPVRILVDNRTGCLALGQTIRATVTLRERARAVQVPTAAIMDLGEGPVLGVVRGGKAVMLRPRLGAAHDGWVAVSNTDLKDGEPVIVEGGYNLPEGTPVRFSADQTIARAEVRP
jgi:multidrug efflux pump subunit AcrA (membrane-fusion protein)